MGFFKDTPEEIAAKQAEREKEALDNLSFTENYAYNNGFLNVATIQFLHEEGFELISCMATGDGSYFYYFRRRASQ